jgi:hypothetical protein
VLQQNTTDACEHVCDADRALTGTWVIDEVRFAVQKSYKIIEICEVYEYTVTQYDPKTGHGGLFVECIDTFLKLKAKASGYPEWVRTPDDEDKYVQSFWGSEAISLDKDAIKFNAAKRGLANLCLNSMWGKLAERANRPQTKLISDRQELCRVLASADIEVCNMLFANDKVLWIAWRNADADIVPNLPHTNDVIGSFVTAGARIHLYGYLDRLGDRALNCDTDSVMYVQSKDRQPLVQTGDRLGAMTSEIAKNEKIIEWACAGPKNYVFKFVDSVTGASKTTCKVRGLTLNFSALQVENFEKMRDMILSWDGEETVTVHTERQITRKRCEGGFSIITEPADIIYRASFLKRRRLADNSSVPFGYI